MQEISESATQALELAEQRLAEAAAELQRRSEVLQGVAAERDAALAKVRGNPPCVSDEMCDIYWTEQTSTCMQLRFSDSHHMAGATPLQGESVKQGVQGC